MYIQVISGSAKKSKLKVPKEGTKPLSSRAKQALFSMIDSYMSESTVLDLFAGSGALGIECLSRGVGFATFVDISKESIDCIQQNLEKTGFSELSEIHRMFAKRFISYATQEKYKYDLIFITPPYKSVNFKLVKKAENILEKNGLIVAEHPSELKSPEKTGNLNKVDERKYGRVGFSFYKISANSKS